jgi:molybdopterin-guanine dinucleotide biosynthesis protein B
MVLVVAAIGRSGSGKTVTLEYLTAQFSKQGFKVGTIKHVHHKGFTLDTKGKNTWRFAQAGAKVVVIISPEEAAIIKKTNQEFENLDKVMKLLENEDLDIVLIEGLHSIIGKRADVFKIITAENLETLTETLDGTVAPILGVSGVIAQNTDATTIQGLQVIKIPQDGKKLVELIKEQLADRKSVV